MDNKRKNKSGGLLPVEVGEGWGINKPSIDAILDKHNVTVDDFVNCMKRGLNATKDIKDRDGDLIETVPDLNVQHKFFVSGMELLGYLKGHGDINIHTDSEDKKQAQEAYLRWRSLGN